MQKLRFLVQVVFLFVFISLMFTGKAQFWMAFIFTSIALTIIFGRFYCGWACPINTLMRPANLLGRRLAFQRVTPKMLKSGIPRKIVFIIFLFGLGYTIYSITQGRKFPLPLIIIPFGLLSTIFINPTAWHRYLCPWGTFFSLTGRFTRLGIKPVACNGCKSCRSTCPTESISYENKVGGIDNTNCLLCLNCVSTCNVGALKYGLVSRTKQESAKKGVNF